MRRLEVKSASEWDRLIEGLPNPHILQTWEWGQAKLQNGWHSIPFIWESSEGEVVAAALILSREVRLFGIFKLRVLYCPKGPNLQWQNAALREQVLADLENFANSQQAVFIKIDPDVALGEGVPGSASSTEFPLGQALSAELVKRGWCFSADQIQFRNTVLIDLRPEEDQILAAMRQKTRYNIRLASRKGLVVRLGSPTDFDLLYQMYSVTAVRDGFVIRHKAYYTSLWQSFFNAGMAHFLIAEFENQPIAALVLFHFAGVSRYMFGMSLESQRDLMPNYLLQWEAIRLSRQLGCHTYDLWGAPNTFDPSDAMWGVYRFKEGFNGTTLRTLGAWDYAPHPRLYRLYTRTLPRILDLMRKRGRAQNKKEATND